MTDTTPTTSSLKSLVSTGLVVKPPRILLYSIEGIGKSSFGASAFKPIFIQLEDGLDEIMAPKFPKATSFDEVMNQLELLCTEAHDYKTVVIDTIDWLEPLVWAHTCAAHGVANIEEVAKGYGKGYVFAMDYWLKLLKRLDYLRNDKGMAVILIGHSEIKRFDSPDVEPYDRYQVKLHKLASAKIIEWADAVLFVNYQIFIEKTDIGFSKKVVRATGGQSRIMYTQERPAFRAKSRYDIPAELPFDKGEAWGVLMQTIKASKVKSD